MIDYTQIHEDLVAILVTGPSAGYTNSPNRVFLEAMEREARYDNMPFLNVRLSNTEQEIRSIPDGYYAYITFEVDVVAYGFNHFTEASRIRDDLLRESQLAIQQNSDFSNAVQTSVIGESIRFFAGTPEGQEGHVASATYSVVVEVSIEPA